MRAVGRRRWHILGYGVLWLLACRLSGIRLQLSGRRGSRCRSHTNAQTAFRKAAFVRRGVIRGAGAALMAAALRKQRAHTKPTPRRRGPKVGAVGAGGGKRHGGPRLCGGGRPSKVQRQLNQKVMQAYRKNKVYRSRDFKRSVWG